MNRIPALAIGVLLATATVACDSASARSVRSDIDSARVERGRYIVEAVACHDCHTPKKMGPDGPEIDRSRLLSGHPESEQLPPPPAGSGPWMAIGAWDLTAWSGPWGVSYAANLTPDQNTGLGIWTEQMFLDAIRKGRHMGVSRPILPPMPWQAFRTMTDDDLKAVFAYLRSIPPVHNRVPDPVAPPVTTH
jgi:mono/diheme cytochrome c family protein